jgi:ribonuclease P protein component
MKKENRILKTEDFNYGLKNFNKINSKHFIVFYSPSSKTRLGIIVSKKVSKKAVIRNKIKRQFKNIFYSLFFLNNEKNFDVIFLIRQEINSLTFEEISNKLNNVFKKIHGDDNVKNK